MIVFLRVWNVVLGSGVFRQKVEMNEKEAKKVCEIQLLKMVR